MNPKEIKLYNRNAPCSVDYFSPHGVLKNKRKWLDDHELYQAIINDGEYKRIVTPVYLKGSDKIRETGVNFVSLVTYEFD